MRKIWIPSLVNRRRIDREYYRIEKNNVFNSKMGDTQIQIMAANKELSSNINFKYISNIPVFYWPQLPPELSELIHKFIEKKETMIFQINYSQKYPFVQPEYKIIYYKGVYKQLIEKLITIYNKREWSTAMLAEKDILLFATLFNETIANECLSSLL